MEWMERVERKTRGKKKKKNMRKKKQGVYIRGVSKKNFHRP
jgi:hypothetical protein